MLFCVSIAFSQSNQTELAQKATQEMVSTLQLDVTQTAEIQKIQERKYRNLGEIEGLKISDKALYLQKLQSLEYGTDMSILRLLKNDKNKYDAYNKIRSERRLAKAKFQKGMKNKGLSAEEIETKYWENRLAKF